MLTKQQRTIVAVAIITALIVVVTNALADVHIATQLHLAATK
jgi:hypothetical protein